MLADNQGHEALKREVANLLRECQYTELLNYKTHILNHGNGIDNQHFAQKVKVGKNIYGLDRTCSFVIFNKRKFKNDLIIECRWQGMGGTVYEKYPFFVNNIVKTGIPTVIILDGGHYKLEAKEWLLNQVQVYSALEGVYSLEEFRDKVYDGFLFD